VTAVAVALTEAFELVVQVFQRETFGKCF
jgi:hypothetical protein